MLAKDRQVFEYWHHAACYLPMHDYRYHWHRCAHRESARMREWFGENAGLVDHVLGRIREEGGLRSADFEAPPDHVRGGWWSRKPAGA